MQIVDPLYVTCWHITLLPYSTSSTERKGSPGKGNQCIKETLHSCLSQHYSQQLEFGLNLDSHQWMNEYSLVSMYVVEYYSSLNKHLPLLFMTRWIVDLEDVMLSEISQTQKDKHSMISLTWNLKMQTCNINPF